MTLSFTVQTFNGHDTATPARTATFVGLQERGPVWHGQHMWYPDGLQEAMGWNGLRFAIEDQGKELLHRSGRFFGKPNTSPPRWALWIAGTLDGEHKPAVICTHLANNAWGPAIRGERLLRLRLWWTGWIKVRALQARLTRQGYDVFVIGDLNRTNKFWTKRPARMIGTGFDRIIYPAAVELLEAWSGDPNGSDHAPLFGRFRFKEPKR